MINNLTNNKLKGGAGDNTPSDKINPNQLSLGVQIEMEHSNDPEIAKEIAMDHLTEDPEYYTKLIKAGLAKEFQPSCSSGFGDPDQSFNDPARLGNSVTATPGNNIVGTIGHTPDGHTDGRNSDPIVNKTVDIELQERRKKRIENILKRMREGSIGNGVDRNPIQVFDGPSPAEASPEGLGTFGSGYDFVGYAETKDYSMKQARLTEIIKKIARQQLAEQEGADMAPEMETPETPEDSDAGEAPETPEGPEPEEPEKAPEGGDEITITLDRETAQKLMSILTQQLETGDSAPTQSDDQLPPADSEVETGGDQTMPTTGAPMPTDGGDEGSDEESIGEITYEQSEAIDETKKKWMQKAFDPKNKGKLHKQLGVPAGKKIPGGKLAAAAKKGGKTGKRAKLAMIVNKFKKKK